VSQFQGAWLPAGVKCGKIRRASPYSSVDRALPSGGKNRRSSRRRGAEGRSPDKPLNPPSGVFFYNTLVPRFTRQSILISALCMALSACQPAVSLPATTGWERNWVYTDLRAYDPIDAGSLGSELIAIYTRFSGRIFQVRLDWLDLALLPDIDLYLALDTAPGGTASLPILAQANLDWDDLIIIPATGPIRILSPDLKLQTGFSISVSRDPTLDEITVQIRGADLPPSYPGVQLQLFATRPHSPVLIESSPVVDSNQPSPPPVDVLFAFWNTFPAYTPAQALRRWDGAHTGPSGGRHGLYNLLRAFRNRSLPLALLDVKWPALLSALDYAGGMPLVKDMARKGLLILPDALPTDTSDSPIQPDWVQARAAADSRQAARLFDLPASQFLTAPLAEGLPKEYIFVFIPQPEMPSLETVSVLRRGGQRLLPIPAYGPVSNPPVQATPDGPSLELLRALVRAANASEAGVDAARDKILILGGDLPASAWGEPVSAGATLDYLTHKPWIRILGVDDLVGRLPVSPAGTGPAAQPDPLLETMRGLRPSTLSKAAWQAYLALNEPLYPASPEISALRKVYRIQVEMLIDAARWEVSCTSGDCAQSVVRCDPAYICMLASAKWYAVVDQLTGGLIFLFYRAGDGQVHQLIGPTSQLVVGQSDPAAWHLDRGFSADPAVIPGGFTDEDGPYQPITDTEKLTLIDSGGQLRKRYSLSGDTFLIEIEHPQPSVSRIPIVFDPWRRLVPGWGKLYRGEARPDGWQWGFLPGPQVVVHTNGRVTAQEFTASLQTMGSVEDPNFDFPPGHYLDFPLALLEIQAEGMLRVELHFSP
jgi:hypothetical protein